MEGILILYIYSTMQGTWCLVKYHSAIVGQSSKDITEFEGVDERRTLVLHKTAEFSTSNGHRLGRSTVGGSLPVSEWQELI
jgi:hypothetical protein